MSTIYTKKGDKGQTSLLSSERVSKDDIRVETYGTFDEAGTLIGLARVHASCAPDILLWLQNRNFALCAELAGGNPEQLKNPLTDSDVQTLEHEIDRIEKMIARKPGFSLPANNAASGFLHQARTVVRRGERRLTSLQHDSQVREVICRYVNRLSDCLYMLAREEEFVQDLCDKVMKSISEYGSGGTRSENRVVKMDIHESKLYDIADVLISAGSEMASRIGVPMVLAVVDKGGNLVAYRRMRDSLHASINIAQGKAFTAMSLRTPTCDVAKDVQPGGALYGLEATNAGKIVPFGGGYPLFFDGELIGGFGMSGGTIEEDMKCAEHALLTVKNEWGIN